MKFMKQAFFFFAPLALAFAAQAQTNEFASAPRVITLDDCIQQALAHNLDVQIERYNPWLSSYEVRIAYGGYDPLFAITGAHGYSKTGRGVDANGLLLPPSTLDDNFIASSLSGSLPWGLKYDLQGNSTDTWGSYYNGDVSGERTDGSASISLAQPLLKDFWIDSTRLNISVAKNRVKWSEQVLRQQIISTVSAVETAYYELTFARENVKVQDQALQLAEQLFSENKKRVEVGVLAPLDEKQAGSQVATARAALLTAQQTLRTDENILKTLITDNYVKLHDVTLLPGESLAAVKKDFSLQDSWKTGMLERPELLQAKLDLEKSGIQLKYDYNQVFPQLDLIGSYGYNGNGKEFSGTFDTIGNGNQPLYTYGVKLSIPLGNVSARNRYKQGKVNVQQALLTVKKIEQDVMVEIDNAIKAAQASFERVDATHEARRYAEAALDAEQKKLENGKSTSFIVLQLQTNLTTARSNEIRALADYNEALTRLAQVEGSTLARRRIDIKAK